MSDPLEELVESLLYEGYALYPYTPGATKNATPTPFGIVYPPAYAETLPSVYDHLELRCTLFAPADGLISAQVRFLIAGGQRHQAVDRRVEVPGVMVGALASRASEQEVGVDVPDGPPLVVGLSFSARELERDRYEVRLRVENRTVVRSGLDRRGALLRALLSTHPILRSVGGRLLSPLDRDYDSVNTFPVLAGGDGDVLIGATIMLPDNPQIAPESRGSLFDGTEIEEALLLHVQVLSDEERAEIERQDPAVREMIARASAATDAEILALHGRTVLSDPAPDGNVGERERQTDAPPTEPDWLPDPRAGEETARYRGRQFRRGGKVVIRPGPDADLHARMLDGRTATIERIFTAYDGQTHFGVTIDDDPGQDLMRETGRYLYFFAPELEELEP